MSVELAHTNGKVHIEPAKYSLLKLDPQALQALWPTLIRPGLNDIKKKDKRSGQWLPEHVRAAIDAGHRGLMFCECSAVVAESGKPVGFIITRLYPDEFVNVPLSLFVWITWSKDPDAVTYVLEHGLMDKRAREIGVRYVDGISSRTAWVRRLRRHGYEIHQIVLRKRIAD